MKSQGILCPHFILTHFLCNRATSAVFVCCIQEKRTAYPNKSDTIDSFVEVMTLRSILYKSGHRGRLPCVFICSFSFVEKLGKQYCQLSYSHFTCICFCHRVLCRKKILPRMFCPLRMLLS